jgi:hypothetical protein
MTRWRPSTHKHHAHEQHEGAATDDQHSGLGIARIFRLTRAGRRRQLRSLRTTRFRARFRYGVRAVRRVGAVRAGVPTTRHGRATGYPASGGRRARRLVAAAATAQ